MFEANKVSEIIRDAMETILLPSWRRECSLFLCCCLHTALVLGTKSDCGLKTPKYDKSHIIPQNGHNLFLPKVMESVVR